MLRAGGALAAALSLHALLWALLWRLRPVSLEPARRAGPVEIDWTRAGVAPSSRSASEATRAASPPTRPAPRVATTSRAGTTRAAASDAPRAAALAPPGRSPAPEAAPSGHGPVDLFPSSVLSRFGAVAPQPGGGPGEQPGTGGRGGPPSPVDEAGVVAARVQGWLDHDRDATRTGAGRVAPAWRDVERRLAESFAPPVAVVHDVPAHSRFGDRLATFWKQSLAVVVRGEAGVRREVVPGSREPERGIDPASQGFLGVPEGLNLRATPLAQQDAVKAATGQPALWLHTEVEVSVDEAGQIVSARVVVPSGRRAFDRYALAQVQARAGETRGAAATTHWAIEAGYAVSPPTMLGATFDLDMLFNRAARRQLAFEYPLSEHVRTHVSLEWTRPLAR
jgi:hypothetical protein